MGLGADLLRLDDETLLAVAERLWSLAPNDAPYRNRDIARNAPRVLDNGVDVKTLSDGTAVWGGPSRFPILNFLDTASPAASWLGGNVTVTTGAASRTLSTLSAFPTATMLIVSIYTGGTTLVDTSATSVTYNGVAMTQLTETSIVDSGEQLYGEIWYMINPPCDVAHNVVASFTNIARTCDIGIGIFKGPTTAPTVQTLTGPKATPPTMSVTNVGETGVICWEFGQRSAIGSSPTSQSLNSSNATSFDSGVGGEAQIVQRYSIGNASVAGQVSTSTGSSTGMPWILFGISMQYAAGGGFSLAINKENRNQVDIRKVPQTVSPQLMNADYVVDSNGAGTHTTLFGTGGALEAAIATGSNRFIWVCATHSETRTSTHTLSAFGSSQRIMVMSGSPYRASISFDFNGAAITNAGASASNSRLQFFNIQFAAATGRTVDFFSCSSTQTELELDTVNFQGPGTWRYLLRATASLAFTHNLYRRITGTFTALVTTSNSSNPTGDFLLHDSTLTLTNIIERGGASDDEVGATLKFTDNRLTVSGYGLRISHTDRYFLFADNKVTHAQTSPIAFIQFGIPFAQGAGFSAMDNCTVTGNHYNGSSGGGNATCFFWAPYDAGGGGGTSENITVDGNALLGPGGSSVAIQFDAPTSGCSAVNGYKNWGTNVGGAGASGVATGTTNALLDGVNHTDTLAGTVVRGDVIVGNSTPKWARVAKGAAGSVLYGDGTDTAWTINPLIAGYMRVGSSSAPTNTTAGDLTAVRVKVGDGAFGSGVEFSVTGDGALSGFLRVGSETAPTNTTPGDLTVERLSVGQTGAFSTTGYFARFGGTMTDTANGAVAAYQYGPTISPSSNSLADFRVLFFQGILAPSTGVTLDTIQDARFESRWRSDAAATSVTALYCCPILIDSSSPAAWGNPTLVRGLLVEPIISLDTSKTGSVTTAIGVDVDLLQTGGASFSITAGTAIRIRNASSAPTALITFVGLDIEALTRGSTNFGIRNASNSVQTQYARFGAVTAGNNTTDGDVTAVRISVGNRAIPSGTGLDLDPGVITFDGESAPGTPAADDLVLYNQTTTKLIKVKDDAGTVVALNAPRDINILVASSSALTTSDYAIVAVSFAGTIDTWDVIVGDNAADTLVLEVSTAAEGSSAGAITYNSITGGGAARPAVTAAVSSGQTAPTGAWTATFSAGTIFKITVATAPASAKMVLLKLKVRPT